MINILICDDYPRTLEILSNMVTNFYQNIDFKAFRILTFNNSTSTLSYIRDNSTNKFIYILDVDLGEEKNGLMLGKSIRKLDNYSGEMVFVTNHTEMSFKAFQYKLRALEFIDKTYFLEKQLKESLSIATDILLHNEENNKVKQLQVKFGSQLFNIPFKEIIYIETIKDSGKLLLCTQNNRIEFYSTLKDLKILLDDDFIQTHKNTIVNKNFILSINKSRNDMHIELKTGIQCQLSKSGLKEVYKHWTC
ncbi:MAG: two-component system response regulator AgrA [Clostridium sp.]|jgi:two-component system response regulator AgrA